MAQSDAQSNPLPCRGGVGGGPGPFGQPCAPEALKRSLGLPAPPLPFSKTRPLRGSGHSSALARADFGRVLGGSSRGAAYLEGCGG